MLVWERAPFGRLRVGSCPFSRVQRAVPSQVTPATISP